jgi:hypothetical protein
MSLSGPSTLSFQRAIEAAFAAGLPIATSAGNQNKVADGAPCV